jgi:hypothetical protein
MDEAERSGEPDREYSTERVSRRAAMKIAAAGTTVAAVWAAPRIEGMSVVPNYAAAATCVVPGDVRSTTKNSAYKACGPGGASKQICWGNAVCSAGGNSGNAVCDTANGALPVMPKPSGNGNIGLAYSSAGAVFNGNSTTDVESANSKVSGLSLTGMDANVASCTLDVTGSCSLGSFRAGTVSTALGTATNEQLVANGSFSDVWVKCTGTSTSGHSASFTLTLSCEFIC